MNKSQLRRSWKQQPLSDYRAYPQGSDIQHIIKLVLAEFFKSFMRPLKVTSLPSHLEKTLEHAAHDYYLPAYMSCDQDQQPKGNF
jgi:hypothetical protein